MITRNAKAEPQFQIVSIDQLVPQDHLLRKIDETIDFSFIYDLVEEKYSPDKGRPSIDPVTLVKMPVIQYLFGIPSMRRTVEEIEVNVAYRWFLGLDFYDQVPHFSTFGKNYKRRFEGTDLFEQIFSKILLQCMQAGLVDTETIFVDSTHVKAAANRKKMKKVRIAKKAARSYEDELKAEIDRDREAHGKKPLKDKDEDLDDDQPLTEQNSREQKQSTTDPESGWFHKGDHREEFAYSIQTGCDRHGWILGYTVHPGNENDKATFFSIYDKLQRFHPENMVMDSGFKGPAIARRLMLDGITPIFPYMRTGGKKNGLRKREFIYDAGNDIYCCPNGQELKYSTTNREGYREYKSNGHICVSCPYLEQCTRSQNHMKVLTRHVWQRYLDICEEIRHEGWAKALYAARKETIERVFGTAKERHGMRYTQQIGNEKMRMKVGLTFACMNMKKLAGILKKREKMRALDGVLEGLLTSIMKSFSEKQLSYV